MLILRLILYGGKKQTIPGSCRMFLFIIIYTIPAGKVELIVIYMCKQLHIHITHIETKIAFCRVKTVKLK
jgi:hypothetical protein